MRVLYPENPLNSKEADEPYQAEYVALQAAGIACSLFDLDALAYGEFRARPRIETGEQVLYRGWMMNPARYEKWVAAVCDRAASPITSTAHYLQCHHLPGWYHTCADLTMETHFFEMPFEAQALRQAEALGWGSFFVKDFVKSNTAQTGSIARSPQEIVEILEHLAEYRGEIEGGVALRKVEQYEPRSEQRYFVMNDKSYGPAGIVPEIVKTVASRVSAPFYSVDIATTVEGTLQVVELGDGQVSDKKNWPLDRFVDMLIENASASASSKV